MALRWDDGTRETRAPHSKNRARLEALLLSLALLGALFLTAFIGGKGGL